MTGNDLTASSPTACGTVQNYTLGCNFNGSAYTSPYIAPNFNKIFLFGDVGKTGYNSLQIKLETRTTKGLYALVAYTYSRTNDNGLTDGLGSVLSAPYFPLPTGKTLIGPYRKLISITASPAVSSTICPSAAASGSGATGIP